MKVVATGVAQVCRCGYICSSASRIHCEQERRRSRHGSCFRASLHVSGRWPSWASLFLLSGKGTDWAAAVPVVKTRLKATRLCAHASVDASIYRGAIHCKAALCAETLPVGPRRNREQTPSLSSGRWWCPKQQSYTVAATGKSAPLSATSRHSEQVCCTFLAVLRADGGHKWAPKIGLCWTRMAKHRQAWWFFQHPPPDGNLRSGFLS